MPVSPEVREVLRIARQVSEWTGGKFDVTFGALSGLWKFDDQDKDDSIPIGSDVLAAAAAHQLSRRRSGRTGGHGVSEAEGDARATSAASARATPSIAPWTSFAASGLRDFMIQAGGDLYVAGRRGDRPWRLGIRDPRGPADKSFAALDLTDGTFSTSGDYERFFMKDGRRYHHILDPADRASPARGCRSVTLVTDRAVIADALAKGVFILGPDAGMALIERLPERARA